MCGIVGAVAQRDVIEILLEGLRRLEYRGYDSAGVAVLDHSGQFQRVRCLGKVKTLADTVGRQPLAGSTGIAHTRWATHGQPSERNAHPHVSNNRIAVVHNGIIENHVKLRSDLQARGFVFTSETDTEVIAHLVEWELNQAESLLHAVQKAVKQLHGAYGMVILDNQDPDRLVLARSGSPMVIGLGIGENFIASDPLALLPVTRRFVYLEEGDVAEITRRDWRIFDSQGAPATRDTHESSATYDAGDKGPYRHYMLKEIHEQPNAVNNTLEGRLTEAGVLDETFGNGAAGLLEDVEHVQIIACGTSYHSGMVARYWLEGIAGISCSVEIASEFRYRKSVVRPKSLLVTISQSGETADTLAALRLAKTLGYVATLCICNVAGSSLVRESDLALMTRAGTEIGVASTKAFTTQLVGLAMLTLALGKHKKLDGARQRELAQALMTLPGKLEETLRLAPTIEALAEDFSEKQHALFLGRGEEYPIAMEGALKLKEISYIHAEAYAAGELKHGPLALIDADMPIIVVAPSNDLLEKLKSNIEEVRARGGLLYVFADERAQFEPASGAAMSDVATPDVSTPDVSTPGMKVINLPRCHEWLTPIIYTVPLQLLAYYVAIIRGTDVDQPRNLAKSVTVE